MLVKLIIWSLVLVGVLLGSEDTMAAIEIPVAPAFDGVKSSDAHSCLVEPARRILSISEFQTDHVILRRILDDTGWRLTTADSCHDARRRLASSGAVVAFCEATLPDGTWKDVLDFTLTPEVTCSLVVTSTLIDPRLWSEVLNLGGFDVLSKPFVEHEVRRVLESVWNRHANPVKRTRALHAAP